MKTEATSDQNRTEKRTVARYGSVKHVAQHTGISESILNKRRQAGLPPKWFKPVGFDRVLYDFDEVDAWIRGNASEGNTTETRNLCRSGPSPSPAKATKSHCRSVSTTTASPESIDVGLGQQPKPIAPRC